MRLIPRLEEGPFTISTSRGPEARCTASETDNTHRYERGQTDMQWWNVTKSFCSNNLIKYNCSYLWVTWVFPNIVLYFYPIQSGEKYFVNIILIYRRIQYIVNCFALTNHTIKIPLGVYILWYKYNKIILYNIVTLLKEPFIMSSVIFASLSIYFLKKGFTHFQT